MRIHIATDDGETIETIEGVERKYTLSVPAERIQFLNRIESAIEVGVEIENARAIRRARHYAKQNG